MFCRYDIFKNLILNQRLMQDGLALHFTSSFLAVSPKQMTPRNEQ